MELSELIKTSRVDNVQLSCPLRPSIRGTLCITSHHLLLSPRASGSEEGRKGEVVLWLLHRNVDAIEKRLGSSSGTITLKCKDLRVIQLEIPGMEETLNIANSIEALSSLESVTLSYPFFFRPGGRRLDEGWHLYPLQGYYQQILADTDAWRWSEVNDDFAVCASYPPGAIVPRSMDDEALKKSAKFRQGGRFPTLSYYHRKNGTVMLRSAQPQTGPNVKRCHEDEMLLGAVLEGGERGFIIDTRTAQTAKQARMLGGGFESKGNYPQWRRLHRPLERGRVLQDSFVRLVEACNDPSLTVDRWLSRLEGCKWLSHVKEALSTACMAAQCMEREEACVLVHGGEGLDTTLLVTALAQLILDPESRTIAGFQALIEREWLQAGHPFQLRCARSAYAHSRVKQEAPTFLLFLDCCWQLGRQFPFSLEFSESLLWTFFQHANASEYGTFLCNNEKERSLCAVKEKTHSLWPFLNQPSEKNQHRNPLYERNPLAIWPSVEPQSLQLWQGFFPRWICPKDPAAETSLTIQRLLDIQCPSREPPGDCVCNLLRISDLTP
ncbi:myotubularin-related protein 9-like isoform X2 [Ambystoma mexicanum]|uniref:myotubularin-related protein 9-like isoform X2 n=1 Tax=Ambystoma mexicanum TaxID=8296 RepID=UPI0037E8593E